MSVIPLNVPSAMAKAFGELVESDHKEAEMLMKRLPREYSAYGPQCDPQTQPNTPHCTPNEGQTNE